MNLSRAASKPTVGPPIPPTQATLGHNTHDTAYLSSRRFLHTPCSVRSLLLPLRSSPTRCSLPHGGARFCKEELDPVRRVLDPARAQEAAMDGLGMWRRGLEMRQRRGSEMRQWCGSK